MDDCSDTTYSSGTGNAQPAYDEPVTDDADMKQQRRLREDEMPTLCSADAVVPTSDVQQEAACRVVKYLSQFDHCWFTAK